MKFGEIAKARTALLNAGTTADRNQLRATLMSHLAKDVETLGQQMATVRADYRRKLERWRTQDVPENVWVSALPSDMHDSWLYRMTGVFALLCEMALAAWIFNWLGVGWWMGVATALGITLTLHGIFLHLFDNPERPKEAIHRLRTRVSLPAIFGFLVALAVGVLARYVQGELAVLLLPAFSFALWLGTLSLVILAASLFTVAHIQGWSARHEKQYRELDREERASGAFLEELRAEDIRSDAVVSRSPFAGALSGSIIEHLRHGGRARRGASHRRNSRPGPGIGERLRHSGDVRERAKSCSRGSTGGRHLAHVRGHQRELRAARAHRSLGHGQARIA